MSPQARVRFPAGENLTKPEMLDAIFRAGIGEENEKIAELYFVNRLPQIDVATELYLGRATVQRRLPMIKSKIEIAVKNIKH